MQKAALSAVMALGLAASLLTVSPAAAYSDSGSLNCTGKGKIAPRVARQPYHGYELAVKQAGPPSSPTWGVSVGPSGTIGSITISEVRVSPYAEGNWSVYSPDKEMTASAACSKRAAPTATPAKSVPLGNKSCTKQVKIYGDGYSDIWISWRKSATGAYHRAFFPGAGQSDTPLRLNTVFTKDKSVFDVKVAAYRSGTGGATPERWLEGVGTRCS